MLVLWSNACATAQAYDRKASEPAGKVREVAALVEMLAFSWCAGLPVVCWSSRRPLALPTGMLVLRSNACATAQAYDRKASEPAGKVREVAALVEMLAFSWCAGLPVVCWSSRRPLALPTGMLVLRSNACATAQAYDRKASEPWERRRDSGVEQEAAGGRAVVHRAPRDVPHGGTFCRSSARTGASSRVSRCGSARRVLSGPGGQTPAPF